MENALNDVVQRANPFAKLKFLVLGESLGIRAHTNGARATVVKFTN